MFSNPIMQRTNRSPLLQQQQPYTSPMMPGQMGYGAPAATMIPTVPTGPMSQIAAGPMYQAPQQRTMQNAYRQNKKSILGKYDFQMVAIILAVIQTVLVILMSNKEATSIGDVAGKSIVFNLIIFMAYYVGNANDMGIKKGNLTRMFLFALAGLAIVGGAVSLTMVETKFNPNKIEESIPYYMALGAMLVVYIFAIYMFLGSNQQKMMEYGGIYMMSIMLLIGSVAVSPGIVGSDKKVIDAVKDFFFEFKKKNNDETSPSQ